MLKKKRTFLILYITSVTVILLCLKCSFFFQAPLLKSAVGSNWTAALRQRCNLYRNHLLVDHLVFHMYPHCHKLCLRSCQTSSSAWNTRMCYISGPPLGGPFYTKLTIVHQPHLEGQWTSVSCVFSLLSEHSVPLENWKNECCKQAVTSITSDTLTRTRKLRCHVWKFEFLTSTKTEKPKSTVWHLSGLNKREGRKGLERTSVLFLYTHVRYSKHWMCLEWE